LPLAKHAQDYGRHLVPTFVKFAHRVGANRGGGRFQNKIPGDDLPLSSPRSSPGEFAQLKRNFLARVAKKNYAHCVRSRMIAKPHLLKK